MTRKKSPDLNAPVGDLSAEAPPEEGPPVLGPDAITGAPSAPPAAAGPAAAPAAPTELYEEVREELKGQLRTYRVTVQSKKAQYPPVTVHALDETSASATVAGAYHLDGSQVRFIVEAA